jgi:uncharacterized protein
MPSYLSPGVYVEEVQAGSRPIEGVGTAIAAFVGLAEKGPVNEPTLVTNWTQYAQTFGEFMDGAYLAHAVYGFFQNGGGTAYIVRVDGDGPAGGNGSSGKPQAELASGSGDKVGAYKVQALSAGDDDLSVEVADSSSGASGGSGEESSKPPAGGGTSPTSPAGGGAGGGGGDRFKLTVKRGNSVAEEYDDVTTQRGSRNVASVVNAASKLIRLEETGSGSVEPLKRGKVELGTSGGGESAGVPDIRPDDYIGDVAERTGFGGLEAIDEVTMVACPDLMSVYQAGKLDSDGIKAVQTAMISHCEEMGDRVAILDPPPGLNAQQIKEWRMDMAGYDSQFASLYWPWITVFDPASGHNLDLPPSGHMAGIWGRNDDQRGVHKAPANEVIRGALDLELNITKNEHDLLNPEGINCIRSFPGRGIRVWGARTLSSDAAWRYLNIRRYFNYLESSILNGTQWCVFEPNDAGLWGRMRRTITAFLVLEWRAGALFGASPAEAFYVKCDEETNSAESIDAGQVICEIGVAPVKPAEFVIFRLSQYSGGAALAE